MKTSMIGSLGLALVASSVACAKKKSSAAAAANPTTAPTAASTVGSLAIDITGAIGLGVGAGAALSGSGTTSASLALDGSSGNTVYAIAADGTTKNALTATNMDGASVSEIHTIGKNVVAYLSGFQVQTDLTGATVAAATTSLALTTQTISPYSVSGPTLTPAQVAAQAAVFKAGSAAGIPTANCSLGMADSAGNLSCVDLQAILPQANGDADTVVTNKHYLQEDSSGNMYYLAALVEGSSFTMKKFNPATLKAEALLGSQAPGGLSDFYVNQDGSFLWSSAGSTGNAYYVDSSGNSTTIASTSINSFAKMPNGKVYFLDGHENLSAFDLSTKEVEATPAVVIGTEGNTPFSGQSYTGTSNYGFGSTAQLFPGSVNAYGLLQNGDNATLQMLVEIYPTPGAVSLTSMSNITSATQQGLGILLVGTQNGATILSSFDIDSATETALVAASAGLTAISSVSASGTTVIFSGTNAAGAVTGTVDTSTTPPTVTIKASSTALSSVAAVN